MSRRSGLVRKGRDSTTTCGRARGCVARVEQARLETERRTQLETDRMMSSVSDVKSIVQRVVQSGGNEEREWPLARKSRRKVLRVWLVTIGHW